MNHNTSYLPLSTRIFWNATASLTASAGRLIAAVIVARQLGPELMGHFTFAVWAVEFIVLLVTFGLPNALMRFLAELQGRKDKKAQEHIVCWTICAYIVISISAGVLMYVVATRWIFIGQEAALSISLTVLLLLQLWFGLTQSCVVGLQDFKTLTKVTAVSSVVSAFGQAMGSLVWSLQGAIVGAALGFGVGAVAFVWSANHIFPAGDGVRIRLKVTNPGRAFLLYAPSAWLAAVISTFVWGRAELFFLERFAGHAQAGYFSIGLIMSSIIVQSINLFSGAFLPHFASLVGRSDERGLRTDYRRLTLLAALVAFPLSCGGAAIMPELINVIFGTAYQDAVDASRIMIATGLWGFATVGSAALYGMGEAILILRWSMLGAALMTGGCLILVPYFGAAGAASVRWLVQGVMVTIGSLIIRYRYNLPFPGKMLASILLSAVIGAVAARLTASLFGQPIMSLVFSILVGAIAYAVGLRLLGVFQHEETAQLLSVTERMPGLIGRLLASAAKRIVKS